MNHTFRQKKKGFTLIELLVVVAIIGVLASTITFAVGGARQKSRDLRRKTDVQAISKAIELTFFGGDYQPTPNPIEISNLPVEGATNFRDPGGLFYYYKSTGAIYWIYGNLENKNDSWLNLYPSDSAQFNFAYGPQPFSATAARLGSSYTGGRGRWFDTASETYTFWGWSSRIYQMEAIREGNYEVYISLTNHAGGDMYAFNSYQFSVDIYVDGVRRGNVRIPGRDDAYYRGSIQVPLTAGHHSIEYLWTNDSCPGCSVRNQPDHPAYGKDANIKIGEAGIIKK